MAMRMCGHLGSRIDPRCHPTRPNVGQDYKSRPRGGTHEGCGAGTPGLSHCWPSRPALWTQLMRMRKEKQSGGWAGSAYLFSSSEGRSAPLRYENR